MIDDEFDEEYEDASSMTEFDDVGIHLPDYSDVLRHALESDRSQPVELSLGYSFPSEIRDNKAPRGTYGGKGVTFRRLYRILCDRFNGGKSFIDDYFDTVYPNTVKDEVDLALDAYKEEVYAMYDSMFSDTVYTKSGMPDRRYKVNRGFETKYAQYEQFKEFYAERYGRDIALTIKRDIKECMRSGQLVLERVINHRNKPVTLAKRRRARLPKTPEFYATHRLIDSLQIHVKIGG
jgi:hypothetical protein